MYIATIQIYKTKAILTETFDEFIDARKAVELSIRTISNTTTLTRNSTFDRPVQNFDYYVDSYNELHATVKNTKA